VLFLGAAAASFLTLNRDAALLRREVMAATAAPWDTKIQLSIGRISLWAVRLGVSFVKHPGIEEARAALQAVRSVSVGVYRPARKDPLWSREKLFLDTDRTMRDRGWVRLVGVADKAKSVLVYLPADCADVRTICLAVVSGRKLVVVSAKIDPDALVDLVAHHAGTHLPQRLAALQR
jgi:hypothetical protein